MLGSPPHSPSKVFGREKLTESGVAVTSLKADRAWGTWPRAETQAITAKAGIARARRERFIGSP